MVVHSVQVAVSFGISSIQLRFGRAASCRQLLAAVASSKTLLEVAGDAAYAPPPPNLLVLYDIASSDADRLAALDFELDWWVPTVVSHTPAAVLLGDCGGGGCYRHICYCS